LHKKEITKYKKLLYAYYQMREISRNVNNEDKTLSR
jgi:hypothetical protein